LCHVFILFLVFTGYALTTGNFLGSKAEYIALGGPRGNGTGQVSYVAVRLTLHYIPQWGSCYSIFSFICIFYRSLFVLLAIVLSVILQYTDSDSDSPFGIFKLFLTVNSIVYHLT
jgi:hypothetical protein